jgi:uncharacterized membrane protein
LEALVERLDPYWGPQLGVAAALALDVFLPNRVTLGPRWLLPSIEGALLLVLVAFTPHPRMRHSALRRQVAVGLIGLVSAVNIFSLYELCYRLLHHNSPNPRSLILAGVLLWLTNVLLFGLWYWELDRGGPLARAAEPDRLPDFMFPQTENPRLGPPDWSPGLIDYLYVSFTNATAFSPTDTMPLSQYAKLLMAAQSLTSLLIVALVIARAVNILR